jgi:hypothetical protein
VSLNQNNNPNLNINSAPPDMFPDNTSSTEVDIGKFCTGCPNIDYHTGIGVDKVDVYQTITTNNNYSINSTNLEITSKSSTFSPSYNLAVGYRFLKNLRIDGEYRNSNFNSELNEIIGNITNNQMISYDYLCKNHSDAPEGSDCYYESLSYSDTNQVNFRDNLLNYTAQNNYTMSFKNKVNYYFVNFFYDTPFDVYNFGFFGGAGAGIASINLSTTTNLPLNLNGTSSTPAYQYKVGTYYKINGNDNVRFLVSLTHINTLGDIKFSSFTMKPISQNSVDFAMMFIP